jgi:hypothetical protein
MESPNDEGSPQEQVEVLQKKKDPVGYFFITVKKDFLKGLQKIKTSWNKIIKNIKESNPNRKRFRRLYGKLEEMESKISEIKDDTVDIKIKIEDAKELIEKMMEEINDIEGYMKENLGSDWKIIKNSWKRCKKGEISKKEFIKIGLSKIGKKFASIFFVT